MLFGGSERPGCDGAARRATRDAPAHAGKSNSCVVSTCIAAAFAEAAKA
jgi:hypothetical protein